MSILGLNSLLSPFAVCVLPRTLMILICKENTRIITLIAQRQLFKNGVYTAITQDFRET